MGIRASLSEWLARSGAAHLLRRLRVAIVAVIGLLFVTAVALVISLIQFQTRISEAKNQSRSFSLTSLSQSVAMQKEIMNSVKTIQAAELAISNFEERRGTYFSKISAFSNHLCAGHAADEDRKRCAIGIASALLGGAPTKLAQGIIDQFVSFGIGEQRAKIEAVMQAAVETAKEQYDFAATTGATITAVRSACSVIERYWKPPSASENAALGLVHFRIGDKGSVLQSFSSEYVRAIRVRCFSHLGFGAAVAKDTQSGEKNAPQGQKLPTVIEDGKGGQNLEADLAGALFFDLIAYYRFYEAIVGPDLTEMIVLAPIDISFVALVIICGALGAMLRIAAQNYNPSLFGKIEGDGSSTSWIYYFVLGIMCSLIMYILSKTAFAGLTESAYSGSTGNLNPFVTAFIAIVSGLICEEAFALIIRTGKSLFSPKTTG